jgi:Ca2+-binding EF-hand superfamily protein
MKSVIRILPLLLALNATSQAQETAVRSKPAETVQQQRLVRFDVNKDGKLDEQELANEKATVDREAVEFEQRLQKQKTDREAVMIRKYDTNKNKILDPDELVAARKQKAATAEALKKYDTNKDGTIDSKEFEAYTKSITK